MNMVKRENSTNSEVKWKWLFNRIVIENTSYYKVRSSKIMLISDDFH